MIILLFIFAGCGLGGLARYGIFYSIHGLLGHSFPYGTLLANVSGSLLMGFLFVIIVNHLAHIAPPLRAFLLIGFLGGYTSFSSFSIETLTLIEKDQLMLALYNIALNVFLCLSATWMGFMIGRKF